MIDIVSRVSCLYQPSHPLQPKADPPTAERIDK